MFSMPYTLGELYLAVLGGLALVGMMFVFTPSTKPSFPRLIERRKRAFFAGSATLYIGLLLFPILRNLLEYIVDYLADLIF